MSSLGELAATARTLDAESADAASRHESKIRAAEVARQERLMDETKVNLEIESAGRDLERIDKRERERLEGLAQVRGSGVGFGVARRRHRDTTTI
jgi:hypothetical protein